MTQQHLLALEDGGFAPDLSDGNLQAGFRVAGLRASSPLGNP